MDRPRRRQRCLVRQECPLNADPAAQQLLLDLQAVDARLDQIAHRRRSLPELAEVDRLAGELARLRDLAVAAETEASDVQREVDKADSDVQAVRQRAERDQQRLDSGAVGNARDLENLQKELASLARRQADLEEVELEAMERLESAQERATDLRRQIAATEADLATTERARDEALAGLAKDEEFAAAQRGELAPQLPPDLLALYDKLRADLGGVGAAALKARRCEGCRLDLTATEVERFREAPADEVLRCEECRRILVRTPESGL